MVLCYFCYLLSFLLARQLKSKSTFYSGSPLLHNFLKQEVRCPSMFSLVWVHFCAPYLLYSVVNFPSFVYLYNYIVLPSQDQFGSPWWHRSRFWRRRELPPAGLRHYADYCASWLSVSLQPVFDIPHHCVTILCYVVFNSSAFDCQHN